MVLKDLFTYLMTCVQCRGMQLNSVILGRRDSPKHKTFSLRLYRYIKFRQVSAFILLHEKFLQFDWLRAVVFQINLKYLHVKITNVVWVVV